MDWEIGVRSITDNHIDWTGEYVKAETEHGAIMAAGNRGYYRNLCVRPSQKKG